MTTNGLREWKFEHRDGYTIVVDLPEDVTSITLNDSVLRVFVDDVVVLYQPDIYSFYRGDVNLRTEEMK